MEFGDFLLPNVLLGDVFALVMNRTPDEIAAEQKRLADTSTSTAPSEGTVALPRGRTLPQMSVPKKAVVPTPVAIPQTSKEAMRLFACNAYPVGTYPNWGGSVIPVSCDACGIPIRRTSYYMHCCECVCPLVDLCVMCFSNGAEFGDHKRTHSYSVVKNKLGNRKLVKLDVFDFLNFLSSSSEKNSLNFSQFEQNVLHFVPDVSASVGPKASRMFGGRGVRSAPASSENTPDVPNPVKQTTDAEKIYLSLINMLTGCREELSVEDLVSGVVSSDIQTIVPGPANYNTLREEFEFEFLPEAETILAAVSPPSGEVSCELAGLLEGYNGILDERERRKRTLVNSSLTSVREFTTAASQKKRKTDEKEAFEKSRIFLRAVSESLDSAVPLSKSSAKKNPSIPDVSSSVKFLDQVASHITTRKRLIDRLKRLSVLWKHGLVAEDHTALQFDMDKKKRNDLNAARIKSNSNSKVWTYLPNQTDIAGTTARTNRGHLVTEQVVPDIDTQVMRLSPIDIFQSLPAGAELLASNPAAVDLCLQLYIAPQHYAVVEIAVHAILRHGNGDEEKLKNIVKDGIFGTTKRYILGGGGPQTSSLPHTLEDMKNSIIKCCRDSFKR